MPTRPVNLKEVERELLLLLEPFVGKKNYPEVREEIKDLLNYYFQPCPLTDKMPGDKPPFSWVRGAAKELEKAEDKRIFEELMAEVDKPLLEDAIKVGNEEFFRLIRKEGL